VAMRSAAYTPACTRMWLRREKALWHARAYALKRCAPVCALPMPSCISTKSAHPSGLCLGRSGRSVRVGR
jgi:hypothetical protein